MYRQLEDHKTENLSYKTMAAQSNIQLLNSAEVLKKNQDSIVILERDQYNYEVVTNAHVRIYLNSEEVYQRTLGHKTVWDHNKR